MIVASLNLLILSACERGHWYPQGTSFNPSPVAMPSQILPGAR